MAEVSHSPEQASKLTRVFSRTPSSWDPQDDLLLRHLKEQQKLGWKEIASHFANRTPNACQFRWRRLRSGSLKSATPGVTLTPASSNTSTPTASSIASGSTPSAQIKDTSTSPSVSPPPATSTHSKSSTSSAGTKPIAVPSYNQWSFSGPPRDSFSKRDEQSTDPLSSSVTSVSSTEDLPITTTTATTKQWTPDEDELLLSRRKRALSFAELSILLPTRTEVEIHSRISELETRSKSTSTIDFREQTKLTYLSTTPRRKRHSSSHHSIYMGATHTPTQRRKSERSFSVSSQTSVGSNTSFINGDSIRSQSFSYASPVLFNNLQPQAISERYILRKESMSSQSSQAHPRPFAKSRSNSIFKTVLNSAIDDDDEEEEDDGVQDYDEGLDERRSVEKDKKEKGLPPLGVLFNEYFTK